jgi:hypothetical protein
MTVSIISKKVLAPSGPNSSGRRSPSRIKNLADWDFTCTAAGWFLGRRDFAVPEGQDHLAIHGTWSGPVKLVDRAGRIEQRVEILLGQNQEGPEGLFQDEEAARNAEALLQELLQTSCFADPALEDTAWQPPATEALAGWFADAGVESAIDREQNLRLTLKRRGCDGQVRVERGAGRLRLLLPLGQWQQLEAASEDAMRNLARAANSQSRLLRIAWLPQDSGRRCEAQVDLSGLPGADSLESRRQQLWREMLRRSVAGLELALRQLGLELPMLADPQNREVAELLCPNRGAGCQPA